MDLIFSGEKEEEVGKIAGFDEKLFAEKVGTEYMDHIRSRITDNPVVVRVDKNYYRPTEVDLLIGDSTKARTKLGWTPEYDLNGLIEDMISSDIHLMKKEAHIKNGGFKTLNYFE
jgi:GDPmannose 4,6-dehydratase